MLESSQLCKTCSILMSDFTTLGGKVHKCTTEDDIEEHDDKEDDFILISFYRIQVVSVAWNKLVCKNKTLFKIFPLNRYIVVINVDNKEDKILIEISARSFLHSQVRIMVGTLVDIAKGNLTDSISQIINSRKRDLAGQTAPACGLYLKKIETCSI